MSKTASKESEWSDELESLKDDDEESGDDNGAPSSGGAVGTGSVASIKEEEEEEPIKTEDEAGNADVPSPHVLTTTDTKQAEEGGDDAIKEEA